MSEPTPTEVLARRLRKLRESLGLSQETVAFCIGLNAREQVSNIESGKRSVKALELASLARLYNTTPAELLKGL